MTEEKRNENRVERLIRFFKGLSGRRPEVKQEDYKGWDQTEEEYQKEQDEWLRKVEEKRRKREEEKGGGG